MMNNTFISPIKAPNLSVLLTQRIQKIDSLVNSLKPKDVLEDEAFENTLKYVKSKILLTPVEVSEPEHVDYEYHEKKLTMEQSLWHPTGNANFYRHEVRFPFIGSGELFYHTSNGFSYSSSDHGIIEPKGNYITIFVDIPTVDPTVAFAEAKKLLNLTFSVGQRSNSELVTWTPAVEAKIDQELKNKRDELKRFFT